MIRDILVISMKELNRHKYRTFFMIIIIAVTTVAMICLNITCNSIKDYLYREYERSPYTKQILIYNDNMDIDYNDINDLKEQTNAQDVKVNLNYKIISIHVEDDIFMLSLGQLKVYDSRYSMLTKSEKKIVKNSQQNAIDKELSLSEGIIVSNKLLQEHSLKPEDVIGKNITVKIYDTKKSQEIDIPIKIMSTIDDVALHDQKDNQCALVYLNSSVLSDIPCSIDTIVYEYETYNNIVESEKLFNFKKINFVSFREALLKVKSEINIYERVIMLASIVIIVSTFCSIVSMFHISFRERMKYYGLLRVVGFQIKHIFAICILQSQIISIFGGIIGIVASLLISNEAGRYITSSIIYKSSNDIIKTNNMSCILYVFILNLLIGTISGILPARRVSKLSPKITLSIES